MSDLNGISLGDEARLRLEVNRLRAERDTYKERLDRVRSVVKLCEPDDITPAAAHVIEMALDSDPTG